MVSETQQITPKEWKCPECKRVRKFEGLLMMKICHACQVPMKLVEKRI